ncbi:MAG: hypothetical protein ACI4TU_07990 [Candidatus Cryptobacteroides sp.]
MKKIYVITATLVTAISIVLGMTVRTASNELFEANVEALSNGEIIVGPLCMVNKNTACTTLGDTLLDHYPA